MRVAKVMLGLSGLLLMSLVLVSFQAAAHPEQSANGLANAPDDPAIAVATTAASNSNGANVNGVAQEPAHNPTCVGHPPPGH